MKSFTIVIFLLFIILNSTAQDFPTAMVVYELTQPTPHMDTWNKSSKRRMLQLSKSVDTLSFHIQLDSLGAIVSIHSINVSSDISKFLNQLTWSPAYCMGETIQSEVEIKIVYSSMKNEPFIYYYWRPEKRCNQIPIHWQLAQIPTIIPKNR